MAHAIVWLFSPFSRNCFLDPIPKTNLLMFASPDWFSRLLHTLVCVSPQLPNELVFASKL